MAMKRRRPQARGSRKRSRFVKRTGRRKYGRMSRRMTLYKRGFSLSVVRTIHCSSTLTFNTVNTDGFWRYVQPSLDSIWTNFNGGATLCSLTNKSEYQALFEQYKLSAVKFMFRPYVSNLTADQNFSGTQTIIPLPRVCILKDPYSVITPTGTFTQSTLNTLLEGGGKVYRADRPWSVYLKPRIREQYGSGAIRHIKPQWTDLNTTAGTTMPHAGFHMFYFNDNFTNTAGDPSGPSTYQCNLMVKLYLKFRNPK